MTRWECFHIGWVPVKGVRMFAVVLYFSGGSVPPPRIKCYQFSKKESPAFSLHQERGWKLFSPFSLSFPCITLRTPSWASLETPPFLFMLFPGRNSIGCFYATSLLPEPSSLGGHSLDVGSGSCPFGRCWPPSPTLHQETL